MKTTEITLTLILIILLPANFFNLFEDRTALFIAFKVIGTFYLLFSYFLLNKIDLFNIFKKQTYQELKARRLIGSIIVGISIYLSVLALSLKFTSSPGATILTMISASGLLVGLIISIAKYLKTKMTFYRGVMVRIIFYLLLNLVSIIIPKIEWAKSNFPNNPEYIRALENYLKNPNDSLATKKHNDEWNKITN